MSNRELSKRAAQASSIFRRALLGSINRPVSQILLQITAPCDMVITGAAQRQAVSYTTRKGVRLMPITLTLHILGFVITIKVKSENRHSAK